MRLISCIVILTVCTAACKKEVTEEAPVPINNTLNNGLVILCEGLFQQNNSTVSWIDLSNSGVNNGLFQSKANRALGDTGNDMIRYGNKVYIAVNVSSTIEVLNATTFLPIQQIEMIQSGVSKEPRYMIGNGSNVYVSCYDGFVDVIDTVSLTVIDRIQVGANPEGLAISNGKLYVSNSGGLNPVMDSTISVVDIATSTELYKVVVGLNPGNIAIDDQGDVYVITRGNYGAIPSRMHRIDPLTDVVTHNFTFDATGISKFNGMFLINYYDFGTTQSNVSLFDPVSESLANPSFLNLSSVNTLYGTFYSELKDRIYVLDAMNFTNTGYVHEYTSTGNYLSSYHVGLNPTAIIDYE